MQTGQPSRTALSAAAHRAAHQVLEGGRIFTDPLAARILGRDAGEIAREAQARPERRGMRLFIAARARFAEDALAAAVAKGVRQLVLLGAGLDTFAYRNPHQDAGLVVFEVDHPATQTWKRARLTDAGVSAPPGLAFAPVDFERTSLAEGLAEAGFDPARPAFFIWAGVVPYLTRQAVFVTLGLIAALPGGAEVVFDYGDPPTTLPAEQRAAQQRRAAKVARLGEPWLTYFEPQELATALRELGFATIEDLGLAAISERFFGAAAASDRGGHLIRASTLG